MLGAPLTPASLLHLQRQAGNAGVGWLLGRGVPEAPDVQRRIGETPVPAPSEPDRTPRLKKRYRQQLLHAYQRVFTADERAAAWLAWKTSNAPDAGTDGALDFGGRLARTADGDLAVLGGIAAALRGVRGDYEVFHAPLTVKNEPPGADSPEATVLEGLKTRALSGMRAIASPGAEAVLVRVFGAGHAGAARERLAAAVVKLEAFGHEAVEVDRRRYAKAVHAAGFGGPSGVTLDEPVLREDSEANAAILVHEATHAAGTLDLMYLTSADFPTASAEVKVKNADHYREAVLQHWGADARTLVPQADDDDSLEAAVKAVDKLILNAWLVSIRITNFLHHVAGSPDGMAAKWQGHMAIRAAVWNSSRLMGLSIHRGGGISAAPPTISGVDLGYAEHRAWLLGEAMNQAKVVAATLGAEEDDRERQLLRAVLALHPVRSTVEASETIVRVLAGVREQDLDADLRTWVANFGEAVHGSLTTHFPDLVSAPPEVRPPPERSGCVIC